IGFSPDGYVYIAGSGDDRIQKFDSDGAYILEWGGVHGSEPGQFHHPNGLTVDGDGFVYTLCWYAHPHGGRIQKFTPWGQYLGETGGIQGTGIGRHAERARHRFGSLQSSNSDADPERFDECGWRAIAELGKDQTGVSKR